mmetsp:Transcript_33604/g.96425  ORF Transcript_33604/g.96425 Transcript_33604/m.96425 type:complete len:122 (-) Transcript_33604:190-555(-)|eukprot:CAMPEP_0177165518 /NCGR_PEP_ID=MMETSP0367-20130122/7546_1 /TAXON_ID=447022 ORGANISM="Scrippsiella hangoei-like, Strain SHHI-4" /NCGR_SAMPLE_ID=MMETSP0367 /ASSEMBLY_ACC=CAM_ASM_000362 /LENGTH=121 /DNA_ID=CAMNT_0018611531 /DNA_START=78 /DNA_END=443 /DNA_ORIENTATION=-
MSALHVIEQLFNKFDYVILGVLGVVLVLSLFTPVFKIVDSNAGRLVTLGWSLYFYVRWQIDCMRIPMKVDSPSDVDKLEFYRMSRNVYMEFSGLVLALFVFNAARLRGRIASLEEPQKKSD